MLSLTAQAGVNLTTHDCILKVVDPDDHARTVLLLTKTGATPAHGTCVPQADGTVLITVDGTKIVMATRPHPYSMKTIDPGGGDHPVCKGFFVVEEMPGF